MSSIRGLGVKLITAGIKNKKNMLKVERDRSMKFYVAVCVSLEFRKDCARWVFFYREGFASFSREKREFLR